MHDCDTDSEDYIKSDDYPKKYVLVGCKGYDMLLMPKKELFRVCDVHKHGDYYATFKEDHEWGHMSGEFDTWMQSYALLHARGWSKGSFDQPIKVVEMYYLKMNGYQGYF